MAADTLTDADYGALRLLTEGPKFLAWPAVKPLASRRLVTTLGPFERVYLTVAGREALAAHEEAAHHG